MVSKNIKNSVIWLVICSSSSSSVEDEVGGTRSNRNGTTVTATTTRVVTIDVRTLTVNRSAISSFNLNGVVWSVLIVWVWNDRQVSDTVNVTGTQDDWGPVTDTRTSSTPDTTIFDGNTGIVNIVLGGSSLSLPFVVGVLVNNGNWFIGVSLDDSWNNHVFGTWVVSSTQGDSGVLLVHGVGGLAAPFTQVLGVLVGTVQLTVLTQQTTDGLTVRRLLVWPLSLGHTGLTSVRTVETVLTRVGGVTVHIHDGGPATHADPVNCNDTLAGWEVRT